jgi:ubiquinol-cytochrome c reductase iron-sulfur subunit
VSLLRRIFAALLALRLLRARGRRRPPPPPDPSEKQLPATPRSELAVAALLLLTGMAGAAFVVVYLSGGSNQAFGITLGLGFVFLAAALGVAGKRVVPQETHVEPVALHPGEPHEEHSAEDRLESAGEGVTRRRAIAGAAGVAGLGLGAALVVPAASLGPNVGKTLEHTPWHPGRRLVDESGKPIGADDLVVGGFVTAFPEGIKGARRERMDVPVILVRLRPDELQMPPDRATWTPEGLVAYSQICTHAGCAVSMLRYPLNEQTSHGPGLVCPCHYSTFDPRRAARVTFGPAGRPLPQLPLALDTQRNVIAAGPLSAPPGPSWAGVAHRRL